MLFYLAILAAGLVGLAVLLVIFSLLTMAQRGDAYDDYLEKLMNLEARKDDRSGMSCPWSGEMRKGFLKDEDSQIAKSDRRSPNALPSV